MWWERSRPIKAALTICLLLFVSACLSEGDTAEESGTELVFGPDPGSFTCNPFDGEVHSEPRTQGVLGQLFYLLPDDPHYGAAVDYIANGQTIEDLNIYFNQLFIPTRPFDRGFVTHSGVEIQTPSGDTLYEYFALQLTGLLAQGSQSSSLKQLALLADDGAVLRVDQGGGFTTLVDNDGTHPTRMGCATEPLDLSAGPVEFEIDYYQGPRYHISLVVMWRDWDPDDVNDPRCNQQGNSLFFDSTQDPPTPRPAYNELLARGWEPVAPENFQLPNANDDNPCNAPAPVVVEHGISAIDQTSVGFRWITDIPSTAQLEVTNLGTGDVITSTINPILVNVHDETLTGLEPNTLYEIKGISASSSGLTVETPAVVFRTLR